MEMIYQVYGTDLPGLWKGLVRFMELISIRFKEKIEPKKIEKLLGGHHALYCSFGEKAEQSHFVNILVYRIKV